MSNTTSTQIPIEWIPSSHFDERPDENDVSLLVIHNISLPPGQFGSGDIVRFFQGDLDSRVHPFYKEIEGVRVSAHCLIERTGKVLQFVQFKHRAWHAGKSSFQGRNCCNDFSIGIEMEGTDDHIFTDAQYASLINITKQIMKDYPAVTLGRIVGHSDIAPGRKTDPGRHFDWCRFRTGLVEK
ncbi:1,6-anhydro-N-acetylmuramyl-L-alanine amidase AmpD [Alteromonas sp. 5E99-2]|uniref:1,6-anhydro-N-acetylmuramyl-L-alanine amidase AmpD n=1 Tax=Alteromonas sp. 5E99-2 TaxID=2817683 RepID=UPI001A994850|nr:1,6-anhydro-N-acetylmuramyl-L-alanine amidase AmpD [Alteromonas sp. 5E99-2]MBO1256441.1 1,6-anhydro-N-acetylmuramyl-L-alanine amidase AmpD [Alteromonas sp. 5E99-2]